MFTVDCLITLIEIIEIDGSYLLVAICSDSFKPRLIEPFINFYATSCCIYSPFHTLLLRRLKYGIIMTNDCLDFQSHLKSLFNLDLFNCEVLQTENYREKMFALVPSLVYLDG